MLVWVKAHGVRVLYLVECHFPSSSCFFLYFNWFGIRRESNEKRDIIHRCACEWQTVEHHQISTIRIWLKRCQKRISNSPLPRTVLYFEYYHLLMVACWLFAMVACNTIRCKEINPTIVFAAHTVNVSSFRIYVYNNVLSAAAFQCAIYRTTIERVSLFVLCHLVRPHQAFLSALLFCDFHYIHSTIEWLAIKKTHGAIEMLSHHFSPFVHLRRR